MNPHARLCRCTSVFTVDATNLSRKMKQAPEFTTLLVCMLYFRHFKIEELQRICSLSSYQSLGPEGNTVLDSPELRADLYL